MNHNLSTMKVSRLLRPLEAILDGEPRPALLLIAHRLTPTNAALLRAFRRRGVRAMLVHPERLAAKETEAAVGLARLDVRPTLDGVEPGIVQLRRREQKGLPLLNPTDSLIACHDKLVTAQRLAQANVQQPQTTLVTGDGPPDHLEPPLVLKPRFGSWGQGVALCRDRRELERRLRALAAEPWFQAHGALAQEYVESGGRDLRVIVAGGSAVGAIERRAAAGEWRTNISLGGSRHRTLLSEEAATLAVAAAAAVDADLIGVDLLPTGSGHTVLELNGAVDFTHAYSLGRDVFDVAVERLAALAGLAGARTDEHNLLPQSLALQPAPR
jgi:[lysine-biosynthesis-protein LysW]--L-2-aminoadipate ligase